MSAVHPHATADAPRAQIDPAAIFGQAHAAALAAAIAAHDDVQLATLLPQADLAIRGESGVTCLQWAMLHRNRSALQALLQAGADPAQPGLDDDTALHMAAMAEDPVFLSDLLAYGASPDTRQPSSGATLLHAALRADRDAQFQYLLAVGASPGLADHQGDTPLHVAALTSSPRRLLALLAAGADPMARNAVGRTFRHYLFMVRPELMSPEASAEWGRVVTWLKAKGLPLDDS